ncbi:hypothetical protein KFE25_008642 [Diacronema lutheri]|uniref:Uncharacterized protein n=1 Tax=Diacronema lutheri TaxID=2081491 RepID=A0A8J5XWB8_DIALT|nr:hypothetical protein KFE25_008642 [Diacronema lutheri]
MDDLIDAAHRALLDPASRVLQTSHGTRRVRYSNGRRPANDNRWWLNYSGGGESLRDQELSDAEQRAAIEAEPAFKSSFLLGFGDPTGMVNELVVLPDYDPHGEVLRGTGAYVGLPPDRKGHNLERIKPKPLHQMRKGHVPVHFEISDTPPAAPQSRQRPASARAHVDSGWARAGLEAEQEQRPESTLSAPVAAAFAASRHVAPEAASGKSIVDGRPRAPVRTRPASAGARRSRGYASLGGNPPSNRRNERVYMLESAQLHALGLGPIGRFIPTALPVARTAAMDGAPPAAEQPERKAGPTRETSAAATPRPTVATPRTAVASVAASPQQVHMQARGYNVAHAPCLPTQRTNRRDPLGNGSRRLGVSLRPSTSAGSSAAALAPYMRHTLSSAASISVRHDTERSGASASLASSDGLGSHGLIRTRSASAAGWAEARARPASAGGTRPLCAEPFADFWSAAEG